MSLVTRVEDTNHDFLFLLIYLLLLFWFLFFLGSIFDSFQIKFEFGFLSEKLLVRLFLFWTNHAWNDLFELAISGWVKHSDVPLMACLVCHFAHLDAVFNLLLSDLCFPLISSWIRSALRSLRTFFLPLIFILVIIIATYLIITTFLRIVVRRLLFETV